MSKKNRKVVVLTLDEEGLAHEGTSFAEQLSSLGQFNIAAEEVYDISEKHYDHADTDIDYLFIREHVMNIVEELTDEHSKLGELTNQQIQEAAAYAYKEREFLKHHIKHHVKQYFKIEE